MEASKRVKGVGEDGKGGWGRIQDGVKGEVGGRVDRSKGMEEEGG